jgi:soluble lytic murein transglycosylase
LSQSPGAQPPQNAAPVLAPTQHPSLPADPSQVWLAPDAKDKAAVGAQDLAAAVKAFNAAQYSDALTKLTAASLAEGPLKHWAAYYRALTLLRTDRAGDARAAFEAIAAQNPAGYLSEAAVFRQAEAAEAQSDWTTAARLWASLSQKKTTQPEEVLMRLAQSSRSAGDPVASAQAFARLYYEFPLHDLAEVAATELDHAKALEPLESSSARYKLELGRAERLFGARRYAQARSAFDALRKVASGDDRELVNVRLAESDHFLKRFKVARDGIQPYTENASRRAEAQFFYLTATRELGDHETYERLARELVDKFPDTSWAEDTLNNLASHFILNNDDQKADDVFRELLVKFPQGRFAERAAWKSGWWAYKNARYDAAIQTFEWAASTFPRSDYRPSYLYWSARARDKAGDRRAATERYTLITADYLNSYYGRLATDVLRARGERPAQASVATSVTADTSTEGGVDATESPLPQNAEQIRALLAGGLFDQALNELQFAQRIWGNSPVIDATFGWIYNQQGDLRRGINAMKRAYPQYLAAGGERLPADVLRILFPINYWPLIQQYSTKWDLDPYMIAALIAQESTFTPDIVSSAKAVGLMQVVAPTGRRVARTLKMRFTSSMLTQPEPNIRLGTAYFADLVRRFGGSHFALASYNAGDHRVARWIAERPGLAQDEFIDDIPFPETQNYVKKILGTAEDYRKLYGPGGIAATAAKGSKAPATSKPSATPKATAKKPAAKKPAAKKPPAKTKKR